MKKPYIELLKDPRWQKKRLEIFQRDEFTCQACRSAEDTLHVHHAFYTGYNVDPWDYPNEILFTLCEGCHAREEANKKIDIYRHLAPLGITRKEMFLLVDHIGYLMRESKRGDWDFPMILHQLVPVEETKDFIKWRDQFGVLAKEGENG